MPRFRIGASPVPPRQFVLPEGERSTAPAPLPPLGKPFKLHEWGPVLATETRKRPVAAQTPKRTPSRPVEAQMGAGGLYTVSAPVGPRKGRKPEDRTVLASKASSRSHNSRQGGRVAGVRGTPAGTRTTCLGSFQRI